MALKEVLKAALQPHKEKLNEWNEEDIELLFMGSMVYKKTGERYSFNP